MRGTTVSSPLIFGIPENANHIPIEIDNDMDCTKMRVRFRPDDFAKIWLKTSCGIRAFYLGWTECGSALKPMVEMAANYRKSI